MNSSGESSLMTTPIPTLSEGTLVGTLTWMRHTLSSFGAESCWWKRGSHFCFNTNLCEVLTFLAYWRSPAITNSALSFCVMLKELPGRIRSQHCMFFFFSLRVSVGAA